MESDFRNRELQSEVGLESLTLAATRRPAARARAFCLTPSRAVRRRPQIEPKRPVISVLWGRYRQSALGRGDTFYRANAVWIIPPVDRVSSLPR